MLFYLNSHEELDVIAIDCVIIDDEFTDVYRKSNEFLSTQSN
jgi:hypothetical protein